MMKKALILFLMVAVALTGYAKNEEKESGRERGERKGNWSQRGERKGGPKGPGGRGGHGMSILDRCIESEDFQQQVGLTSEQIEKLTNASERLKAKREKLEAKRKESGMQQVKALMSGKIDTIDEEALKAEISAGEKINTELKFLRMKELIIFNKTLTDDQRQKVREMRKNRDRKMQEMRERMQERRRGGDEDDEEGEKRRRKKKSNSRRKGRDRDDEGEE